MKVVMVTDAELRLLVESLELKNLQQAGHLRGQKPEEAQTWEAAHRAFHYVVVRWVQEMGGTYPHR